MRRTTKPKRLRVPEKSVESAIVTRLQLNGWMVHKIDAQSMVGRAITYVKNGKVSTRRYSDSTAVVGQPDLIAVKPLPWALRDEETWAMALYIETKAPKGGVLSPEQEACHAVLRKAGFVVLVPHSESEFEQQMKELGLELR